MSVANKYIALIAHDRCKETMVAFAKEHATLLGRYDLIATRTTGTLLNEELGLNVTTMLSGPLGGDLQIGAMVAEGKIMAVIFLRDVMNAQPHEPDISALMRACDVRNVPLATNLASANAIVKALFK
jgi:methylglyoxal synthase